MEEEDNDGDTHNAKLTGTLSAVGVVVLSLVSQPISRLTIKTAAMREPLLLISLIPTNAQLPILHSYSS